MRAFSSNTILLGSDCDSIGDGQGNPNLWESHYSFIKADTQGKTIFRKDFAPVGVQKFHIPEGVINTFDFVDPNKIFLGVMWNGGFFVVHLDSQLNEKWRRMIYYPDVSKQVETSFNMFATSDGGCMLMGTLYYPQFRRDIFVVKVNGDGSITGNPGLPEMTSNVLIYPNPFKDRITIALPEGVRADQILFYDLTGQAAYSQTLVPGDKTTSIAPLLSPGLFYYQLLNNDAIVAKGKVLREK
jgi:hypothetical protein